MSYIPKFYGNPEKFLDWLRTIEGIFDYEDYDDRTRCKLAIFRLREHAENWYRGLKESRRILGKEPIQSWKKLKVYMKRKFLPIDYEQERLFLDTRDPPKPAMIEKNEPYLSSLPSFEEEVERIMKSFKEQQEKEEAAMKAQQQESELVCESNPTPITPTSGELNHDQEEQQTTVEIAQLTPMTSPTKQQIKAIQEEYKQPLVLHKETDSVAVLSMLSINNKEGDKDSNVQEACKQVVTSIEEEEKPRDEDVPLHFDDPKLQHMDPNLRANPFQEREDAVRGIHDDTQGMKP